MSRLATDLTPTMEIELMLPRCVPPAQEAGQKRSGATAATVAHLRGVCNACTRSDG